MSIEIGENPKNIYDLGLVEGIFLNAMVCLLQQPSAKASQIYSGRLSQQLTLSAMKIRPDFVRDLAMVLAEMECDTSEPQGSSPGGTPESPAKQSELYISEKAWSFAKTLGAASSRLVGGELQISPGALSAEGILFLDKDRCTFQDWLLISSILDNPDTESRSISLVPELTQSIADCYRQNLDL
jgi:hypothetical protein